MKRFLSAVALCVALLGFGLFVFLPATSAEKNLLENLLNLPAPPPPNPLVPNLRRQRVSEFYNRNKAPGDDAPLGDLLDYWRVMNRLDSKYTYKPDASAGTLDRLRGEIENNPELLPELINTFPETAESASFIKNLYDREQSENKYGEAWSNQVETWLTYHSGYFSDRLVQAAETVGDTGEYVSNQAELLALARIDWSKAKPILERLLGDNNQPVAQTLARWAFYQHALRENDSSDIDRYRRELQATVENKNAKPGDRDLAMDALIESGDFEGRDDWYYTLLEDETLHDLRVNNSSYTGLTTLLNHSAPEKYTAKMLELLRSGSPAVRSAAVRNLSTLLGEKNPEVVRALIPWLENPKWAKETNGQRRLLVTALGEFQMPESVDGLIAVLNEKQTAESRMSSMSNMMMSSNSMSMNGNMGNTAVVVQTVRPGGAGEEYESYPYRDIAVTALAAQKDFRAAAPLLLLLPQVDTWQRGNIVRAMLASRAFSVPEQVEALEFVIREARSNANANMMMSNANMMTANMVMTANTNSYPIWDADDLEEPPPPPPPAVTMMVNKMTNANASYNYQRPAFNPADIKPLLGMQLINQPNAEDELVTALINRIETLDKDDPMVAYSLRQIIQNWNGAAVNRLLLRDLKNNRAGLDATVKILSLRKQMRENQSGEVADARAGNSIAAGIGACIFEDAGGYNALLEGEDLEARTAMLACARLIRAELPVQKVAENLKSPNKLLATAAERYLESEDSPEARRIVLSLHPNEAKILGAKGFFPASEDSYGGSQFLSELFASIGDAPQMPSYYFYSQYSEDLAATEKKLQKEVKENRELLGVYAYDDNFIRIYKDRAVFSWQEDPARYRERNLTQEEFDGVKNYLATERAADLPPFLGSCESDCEGKELIMLGAQGGRRVFTMNGSQPKFFAGLERIFTEMRQPPAKLHYWLEKTIAGLEILFENENLQAESVWKAGDDFRVLINNESRRKEIDKELERQDADDDKKLYESEDESGYDDYEKLEAGKRKRREGREFENYSWYKLASGELAGIIEQPNGFEFLPKLDGTTPRAAKGQWKARAAGFEIRGDSDGLYKITNGRAVKIRENYFVKPVVTANGRWAVATKYGEEEGATLVRINLQTNREFRIRFENDTNPEAVAYLPAINKVLLFSGTYYEYEESEDTTEKTGNYYFLDAETGAVQPVKGVIRPLAQQTFRPLQPTGAPDEFWAAIPGKSKENTQIGTYNAKTLTFKPLMKISQIAFNSMQMWVDAGKVYFVYEGHLLSLPLVK